ncbi:terminase small subunit [Lacrimispora sp.]|uniref:terminase small subunit n=1 Tax=Lacrimispora sp. TaxID=2719234 RepID=UPI00345F3762
MARAPDEIKERARELYENGVMLKDIASQLDVPEGTVRSWKNRGKWDCNATQEKGCNVAKKMKRNKAKKKAVAEEVESVMSNEDLTDKQRLFCVYYSKSFNATQSYKKAYNCSYGVALTEGPALKNNPRISSEIKRLKQIILSDAHLEPGDIFQKYMDIAYSDITDYLTFGQKEVKYFNKAGEEVAVMESFVDLNESSEVDGSIISEVSQGKEGIKVKLADRMKALDWLSDHMDMATEEQRAKIDAIKAKIERNDDKPIQITFVKAGDKRD